MSNDRFQNHTMLNSERFTSDLAAKSQDSTFLFGKNEGILDLLNQTCHRFKEETAIEWKDGQISYGELSDRSNRLANLLIANQLSKGSIIAVILDDRIEIITTLLAILKAGCVFVPLDPNFPQERLRQIVADVSCDCFITQTKFSNLVTEIYGDNKKNSKIINIEEKRRSNQFEVNLTPINESPSEFGSEQPSVAVDLEQISYIYYTSGSTGNPKGIAGNLKGISHFINWEIETFNIAARWRFSQFIIPTFDPFFRDVFVPLCSGGTICIPPELPARMETTLLIDWIDRNEINLIHCVPSLFGTFTNSELDEGKLNSLNYILMSGETLPVSDVKKWRKVYANRIKLVNLYGATETTMVKFCHQIEESDLERGILPIGKPIKGARAVILDRYGNLCPRGVFGELYIRTPYATLGYYKNPKLTNEVFIPNPFSKNSRDRIYKTGDIARLLNDGNFQLRGRQDDLVKIRGIRVELGDIENQLRDHYLVQKAAVSMREEKPGAKRLVAYIVANQEQTPTVNELRHFLKERLPNYMMPAAFVFLSTLPLTPNGKVDRRALPAPDVGGERSGDFVPPRTPTEEIIANIWSNILGVEVGRHDNFFELGGHSLLATQVISRIRQNLKVELPLRSLFEASTIEELGSHIENILWTKTVLNSSNDEIDNYYEEGEL